MNIVKRNWRIIFPILVAIIIWHFSSMSGERSDVQSLAIAEMLGLSNALTRKLAHVCLYALLGYSMSSFIKGRYSAIYPRAFAVAYALIPSAIYAAVDEMHQLTVLGRSASVLDILLDIISATGGVLLYIAIFCFVRSLRRR